MRPTLERYRHSRALPCCLLLALLLLGPASATADEDPPAAAAPRSGEPLLALPDTPAAHRLDQFVRAFNAGDPAALQALVVDAFEAAERDRAFAAVRVRDLQQLYDTTSGLVLRRIEQSAPSRIEILAQGRATTAWYRVSMFTAARPPAFEEPLPPHKIMGLGIDSIAAPPDMAEAALSERQWRARLDGLIGSLAARDRFSGAVLVQRGGRVAYSRAFGEADRDAHVDNGLRTRFNLASITKMFTAVSVGQLAQAGKLKLSDPVGKLLPELSDTELGKRVTVHHLLSHTSGMVGAREAIEKGLEPPRTARSITQMTASFVDAPLRFRPGQQFDYSNAGYILLGAIIERVSGEDYRDYVQRHVFDVAGMRDTGFYSPSERRRRIATGYEDGGSGARRANTADLPLIGSPANMAFSTVGDMGRFASALYRDSLLRRDVRERLWTGVTERADGVEYGYGARIEHYNGRRIVWHGGGAPGVTNRFELFPDEGVAVVVLSNIDTEPELITNKLREWLFPRLPSMPPTTEPPKLTLSIRPPHPTTASGSELAFELVVSNAGGTAHATIVDLEIKDEAGRKVEQQIVADQKLEAFQSRTFRFSWTPKEKGPFRIDAGVFGVGWRGKLAFEESLAVVQTP